MRDYPGTNYKELVSYSFSGTVGTPGISVPVNSYQPVLIFSQPNTLSLKYISFTLANTSNTPLQVDRIILYDLSSCTNYMFTEYSTNFPDYNINGAISTSEPISTFTLVEQNQVIEINTGCGCGFNIPRPATSRPIGVVFQITNSSGACQLFSCNVGYSDT